MEKKKAVFILLGQSNATGHGIPMKPEDQLLVPLKNVFDAMAQRYPNVSVFDVRSAPQFIPDVRGNGIFKEDMVHFTPEVNRWVAQKILEEQL